jgi:glycosyltransferase involved in cell wall biosynthesis
MATSNQRKLPALEDPQVLVVLPTLGERLSTLQETLKSIDAQRKNVNLTLVVVLPKTASEARELAREFGAKIVDDPKKGISNAINIGIAQKTSEKYYAWMGDDDLFRPNGLFSLKHLLENSPQAVVAYGACDYINPAGKIIATNKAGRLAQFLLPWGPDLIPHPGSMITLESLEEIGLFDPNLKYAMDLDAFLKLRKLGNFVSTTTTVSAFRWHAESLTVSNRKESSIESEQVKLRHLPSWVKPFSLLWTVPIRWASQKAANSLNQRAIKL